MYDDHMMTMAPFIPLFVFTIPLAIGNAFLAKRLGKSVALWVILSLLPGINLLFLYYVGYMVVFGVLDRLKTIGEEVKRLGPAPI